MGSTFGECVCIADVIWSYNNAVLLSEKHESTYAPLGWNPDPFSYSTFSPARWDIASGCAVQHASRLNMLLWLSSLESPLVGNIHLIIICFWNVSTKKKQKTKPKRYQSDVAGLLAWSNHGMGQWWPIWTISQAAVGSQTTSAAGKPRADVRMELAITSDELDR